MKLFKILFILLIIFLSIISLFNCQPDEVDDFESRGYIIIKNNTSTNYYIKSKYHINWTYTLLEKNKKNDVIFPNSIWTKEDTFNKAFTNFQIRNHNTNLIFYFTNTLFNILGSSYNLDSIKYHDAVDRYELILEEQFWTNTYWGTTNL